jgi:hypothetical protein
MYGPVQKPGQKSGVQALLQGRIVPTPLPGPYGPGTGAVTVLYLL